MIASFVTLIVLKHLLKGIVEEAIYKTHTDYNTVFNELDELWNGVYSITK